jgi:hypothetical protein
VTANVTNVDANEQPKIEETVEELLVRLANKGTKV